MSGARHNNVTANVKAFFLLGYRGTAKGMGEQFGSQDIRKVISNLRSQGWPIRDMRLDSSGRKLYWLDSAKLSETRKKFNFKSSNYDKDYYGAASF